MWVAAEQPGGLYVLAAVHVAEHEMFRVTKGQRAAFPVLRLGEEPFNPTLARLVHTTPSIGYTRER